MISVFDNILRIMDEYLSNTSNQLMELRYKILLLGRYFWNIHQIDGAFHIFPLVTHLTYAQHVTQVFFVKETNHVEAEDNLPSTIF